jgi:hypothetical protein
MLNSSEVAMRPLGTVELFLLVVLVCVLLAVLVFAVVYLRRNSGAARYQDDWYED